MLDYYEFMIKNIRMLGDPPNKPILQKMSITYWYKSSCTPFQWEQDICVQSM